MMECGKMIVKILMDNKDHMKATIIRDRASRMMMSLKHIYKVL
mgnify:CR=1 FL=1